MADAADGRFSVAGSRVAGAGGMVGERTYGLEGRAGDGQGAETALMAQIARDASADGRTDGRESEGLAATFCQGLA